MLWGCPYDCNYPTAPPSGPSQILSRPTRAIFRMLQGTALPLAGKATAGPAVGNLCLGLGRALGTWMSPCYGLPSAQRWQWPAQTHLLTSWDWTTGVFPHSSSLNPAHSRAPTWTDSHHSATCSEASPSRLGFLRCQPLPRWPSCYPVWPRVLRVPAPLLPALLPKFCCSPCVPASRLQPGWPTSVVLWNQLPGGHL